jgi:hypothetical protein
MLAAVPCSPFFLNPSRPAACCFLPCSAPTLTAYSGYAVQHMLTFAALFLRRFLRRMMIETQGLCYVPCPSRPPTSIYPVNLKSKRNEWRLGLKSCGVLAAIGPLQGWLTSRSKLDQTLNVLMRVKDMSLLTFRDNSGRPIRIHLHFL